MELQAEAWENKSAEKMFVFPLPFVASLCTFFISNSICVGVALQLYVFKIKSWLEVA